MHRNKLTVAWRFQLAMRELLTDSYALTLSQELISFLCRLDRAFYPFPNDTLYSASKHGVLGLTRAAGVKVFHEGITVNCFGPSVVGEPQQA